MGNKRIIPQNILVFHDSILSDGNWNICQYFLHAKVMDLMEKKKILLRLDPKLHEALKRWADDEFRSLNSHIEFLLKKSLSSNRRTEDDE